MAGGIKAEVGLPPARNVVKGIKKLDHLIFKVTPNYCFFSQNGQLFTYNGYTHCYENSTILRNIITTLFLKLIRIKYY